MEALDQVRLNFDEQNLLVMNLCIGFIMFGVALALRISDFRRIWEMPKGIFAGVLSQFILLPLITFFLVKLIDPISSVALGMILVAACPGGNLSNMLTLLARGDAALSVSLTALCTLLAVVMTPLNFSFWASLYLSNQQNMQAIDINFADMLRTLVLIMGIPMLAGMFLAHKFPALTNKWNKPIRTISIVIFLSFIAGAFASNFELFLKYIHLIILVVLAHNALAYTAGYLLGRSLRLPLAQTKAVAIETGIQNSGLALVIIFNFFDGLGGMAFIAGWWGIWDMISGLLLAFGLARVKDGKSY